MRRHLTVLAVSCATLGATASPSFAIVGGHDAAGEGAIWAPDTLETIVGRGTTGEGCARAGKPGVYACMADTTPPGWIRSQAPDGVD
jgi:hypothetical protein